MRIALLLSLTLLCACSTTNNSVLKLQTTRNIDYQLQAKVRTTPKLAQVPACKEGFNVNDVEDGYFRIRKRWQLLNNCLYSDQGSRKLVVLLDGTENTKKDNTNIWRMYNQALEQARNGARVIPYYDKGVATSITTPFGSVFGSGVSLNIRQAYRFLTEAYKPGDEIYIFGFSRGAFTARSLNGFIEIAGLPKNLKADARDDSTLWGWTGHMHNMVKGMYDIYKSRNDGVPGFDDDLRKQVKDYRDHHNIQVYGEDPKDQNEKQVVVKVIGVFDTVPAVGAKLKEEPDEHRLELYAERGYHAMSLDEQRASFRLLRFGLPQTKSQVLEEVWFAGVHADVGGGYLNDPDAAGCGESPYAKGGQGLETIPLRWMLANVSDTGIFANSSSWPAECIGGPLHDEFHDATGLTHVAYKKAGLIRRKPVERDKVHASVFLRMDKHDLKAPHPQREPKPEFRYDPINLGYARRDRCLKADLARNYSIVGTYEPNCPKTNGLGRKATNNDAVILESPQ
ncbi:T6SS phospholipase effector Tle1-like catalytic domain-containing protein [Pseudomonas chlororaphis]|uniref:phospholipase effector Tle1 domain-containing protein n=1 Tax=Pseudomonas chlororaphis TaxID=587753 RepID=UPI001B311697|nr:DUF2235 domain-containing protein [Pseudomonas chlororaphis]QTT87975.1 DUF2235 domain-containing protein [Pseudomonas chlororaphis]